MFSGGIVKHWLKMGKREGQGVVRKTILIERRGTGLFPCNY